MNMNIHPEPSDHNVIVRHVLDTAQSLEVWREALLQEVMKDGPDLSQRQMAVLLTVYLRPQPHRVRDLSTNLKISKPAITRALDKLEQIGYVKRKPDEVDGRSVLIQRTVKGSVFLSEFAHYIQHAMDKQVDKTDASKLEAAKPESPVDSNISMNG